MIARYVTHISDELEPIKGICYGHEITHFPVQFNYVKIMKYHYL